MCYNKKNTFQGDAHMNFNDIMETMQKVFEVLFDVSKWLNGNIFSRSGSVVDILKKVIDFIVGLFSGDGFLSGLFGGDGGGIGDIFGGGLSGIGDFFGGLFG